MNLLDAARQALEALELSARALGHQDNIAPVVAAMDVLRTAIAEAEKAEVAYLRPLKDTVPLATAREIIADRAAMQKALDALESRCGTYADERKPDGAITALRERLK